MSGSSRSITCRVARSGARLAACAVALGFLAAPGRVALAAPGGEEPPRVSARFDFSSPATTPFPSDYFTVPDASNLTGLRVNLPKPDCAIHASECEDLDAINQLDGFSLQTRISIPFDGEIDPATVTSQSLFLIALERAGPGGGPGGQVIGINQVVWDLDSLTLHVETDELLEQHRRYAVILTSGVLDTLGVPVKAAKEFRHLRAEVAGGYRQSLQEALDAAAAAGFKEQQVVVASVYTTRSVTPVLERMRDQIKAGVPAPANFALGPEGARTVFDLADVAGIDWKQHTRVNPDGFATMGLDLGFLRDVVPGAVGTVAFGTYASPDYQVHPGEYIPHAATASGVPAVQGQNTLAFSLFLPAGERPPSGWPLAIFGQGGSSHQHTAMFFVSSLAAQGIATIAIHRPGGGFGPLGELSVRRADGTTVTFPHGGRGVDQDANGIIGAVEGSSAMAPRAWTTGEADGYRQNVADLLQLVRVIQVGMDVDGDGSFDLDANRIAFWGQSAGTIYGSMFVALEPDVPAVVFSVPAGMPPEHARWSPVRRPALGRMLLARQPSLVNAPGLTAVDGVPVNGPYYDENKPLRDLPAVTNTVAGAMAIQAAFELQKWGQQAGASVVAWSPYLRRRPLAGVGPKLLLIQSARGDQQANNPGLAASLRAGDLADRTAHYRHDVAFAQDTTVPKTMPANPHSFVGSPLHPNALFRAVSRAAQGQAAVFLASGGMLVTQPEPSGLFEFPMVGPPPEGLNYIR